MIFKKSIHWHEGQLLRPQHFQIMQDSLTSDRHESRRLIAHYPYGVISAELSEASLRDGIVEFSKLHAVMSGGMEVIAHQNAHLPSLNLQHVDIAPDGPTTICLAIPRLSQSSRNVVSKRDAAVKSRYIIEEDTFIDQNTGSDSQVVSLRMINARLVLEDDDHTDLEIMPVLQLVPVSQDDGPVSLQMSKHYIPPVLKVEGAQPLSHSLQALITALESARQTVSAELIHSGYSSEEFTGINFERILKLRSLNARLPELINLRRADAHPFDVYLSLTGLLGELAAIAPFKLYELPPAYDHDDLNATFVPVFSQLHSLVSASVGGRYTKIEFEKNDDLGAWVAALEDYHFVTAKEYYFAVQAREHHQALIEAIEKGDQFKVAPSSMVRARVRGLTMMEERFPPSILPSLPNIIWFRIVRSESSRVWDNVRQEKALAVIWPEKEFPDITFAVYATLAQKEDA